MRQAVGALVGDQAACGLSANVVSRLKGSTALSVAHSAHSGGLSQRSRSTTSRLIASEMAAARGDRARTTSRATKHYSTMTTRPSRIWRVGDQALVHRERVTVKGFIDAEPPGLRPNSSTVSARVRSRHTFPEKRNMTRILPLIVILLAGCAGQMQGIIRGEGIPVQFTYVQGAYSDSYTAQIDGEEFHGRAVMVGAKSTFTLFGPITSTTGKFQATMHGTRGSTLRCEMHYADQSGYTSPEALVNVFIVMDASLMLSGRGKRPERAYMDILGSTKIRGVNLDGVTG